MDTPSVGNRKQGQFYNFQIVAELKFALHSVCQVLDVEHLVQVEFAWARSIWLLLNGDVVECTKLEVRVVSGHVDYST